MPGIPGIESFCARAAAGVPAAAMTIARSIDRGSVISSSVWDSARETRTNVVRAARHSHCSLLARARERASYARGGGSSGAGDSARGARSARPLMIAVRGADTRMAMVRAASGATAHDANPAQHGSAAARSELPPFGCDDRGVQSECARKCAAARAMTRGAAQADAVPTTMTCIIASSVSTPNERRAIM